MKGSQYKRNLLSSHLQDSCCTILDQLKAFLISGHKLVAFLKSAAATHLCIGVWRSLYHEALVDLISVMGTSL